MLCCFFVNEHGLAMIIDFGYIDIYNIFMHDYI